MDLERTSAGRMHVVVGPIERWIAGLVGMAVVGLIALLYGGITTRLDEQNLTTKALTATVGNVATQQAVTNGQVATLTQQLSDVPRLKTDVAETKVRVDRLEQDTKELRALQGIRR